MSGPYRNVDESRSIADYYRTAFLKCENCEALELADGIVCVQCSIKLSSIVREATMREPDVSDVARVLREHGLVIEPQNRRAPWVSDWHVWAAAHRSKRRRTPVGAAGATSAAASSAIRGTT